MAVKAPRDLLPDVSFDAVPDGRGCCTVAITIPAQRCYEEGAVGVLGEACLATVGLRLLFVPRWNARLDYAAWVMWRVEIRRAD